jgi:hypothetical protein
LSRAETALYADLAARALVNAEEAAYGEAEQRRRDQDAAAGDTTDGEDELTFRLGLVEGEDQEYWLLADDGGQLVADLAEPPDDVAAAQDAAASVLLRMGFTVTSWRAGPADGDPWVAVVDVVMSVPECDASHGDAVPVAIG